MRLSNKMISLLILQNFYFIIIYFINNKYLRVISHLVKTSLERILSHFTHTHTNIKDITNTTMHTTQISQTPPTQEGHMNESNTHQKERDSKVMQVQDCLLEEDLKELMSTTHTNKIYLLFSNPSFKNSTKNTLKNLVLIFRVNYQS